MAEDRWAKSDESTKVLVAFLIGSLTVGAIVLIALRSLRKTMLGAPSGNPPINIYNVTGGSGISLPAPQPVQPSYLGNQMSLLDGTSLSTKTDTVTLPTDGSARVFSAPMNGPMWKVKLYVLGPAGGFAAFAVDSLPDLNGGQSVIVPCGRQTELRIGARQAISGIASMPGTQASVTAQAEVV